MQQLSNDTSSWSLIDIPLPSPLFYNSNTYDNLVNVGATLNDLNNPLLPISFDPSSSLPQTTEIHSINYWAFALIFFPILTIFGNVLVVVSVYREKSLHTVTNYFVVSLAISDITVAAVVMPFAIYLEVSIRKFCSYCERKFFVFIILFFENIIEREREKKIVNDIL
jgi:dopamine D2-like receptor